MRVPRSTSSPTNLATSVRSLVLGACSLQNVLIATWLSTACIVILAVAKITMV